MTTINNKMTIDGDYAFLSWAGYVMNTRGELYKLIGGVDMELVPTFLTKNGNVAVTLENHFYKYDRLIKYLMASVFFGGKKGGVINIDGNKRNNNLSNLKMVVSDGTRRKPSPSIYGECIRKYDTGSKPFAVTIHINTIRYYDTFATLDVEKVSNTIITECEGYFMVKYKNVDKWMN